MSGDPTSDSITEQAARLVEDVLALDRRTLDDPRATFGKSFYVRRGDVLAILSALAHQAPATERTCPTCGCDERYPTGAHIVDCPTESPEVKFAGDRFFERTDGQGSIERVHPHHSKTAELLARDTERYREVTIQAPATEPGDLRDVLLRNWWDTQTDDTDSWDDLTDAEREAVAENSYVDVHLDAIRRHAAPATEDEAEDDEEFCPRCYAGVESSEHHGKCVVTGHAEDGEPAQITPQSEGDRR